MKSKHGNRKAFVERRRRPDPVALGNWGKMLRAAIDGKPEEGSVPDDSGTADNEASRQQCPTGNARGAVAVCG